MHGCQPTQHKPEVAAPLLRAGTHWSERSPMQMLVRTVQSYGGHVASSTTLVATAALHLLANAHRPRAFCPCCHTPAALWRRPLNAHRLRLRQQA